MTLHDTLPGGLHGDPSRSFTMASRYYTDPLIFEEEKDRIFARSWLFVGHESTLRAPGSYQVVDIADESLALVRGRDGVLRCFYNVCQHRAHRVLKGSGTLGPVVTCPYHAWAYNLDGSLRTARGCENVQDFDKSAFSLKEVRVDTMLGLVFVNLDPQARAVRRTVRGARGRHPALDAPGRVSRTRVSKGLHPGGQLEGGDRQLPGVLPL